MENFKIDLPAGNSREDIRVRDKAIKDFYSSWNAAHPEKKMWNEDLNDYIHVRFLSIEETSEKAARQYESTMAVFRLSDLLVHSKKVGEVPPKKDTKNQKHFTSMLIMSLDNIKMTVGVQKSGNKIQYCIQPLENKKPPQVRWL